VTVRIEISWTGVSAEYFTLEVAETAARHISPADNRKWAIFLYGAIFRVALPAKANKRRGLSKIDENLNRQFCSRYHLENR
jgi:hypothetical protein